MYARPGCRACYARVKFLCTNIQSLTNGNKHFICVGAGRYCALRSIIGCNLGQRRVILVYRYHDRLRGVTYKHLIVINVVVLATNILDAVRRNCICMEGGVITGVYDVCVVVLKDACAVDPSEHVLNYQNV